MPKISPRFRSTTRFFSFMCNTRSHNGNTNFWSITVEQADLSAEPEETNTAARNQQNLLFLDCSGGSRPSGKGGAGPPKNILV